MVRGSDFDGELRLIIEDPRCCPSSRARSDRGGYSLLDPLLWTGALLSPGVSGGMVTDNTGHASNKVELGLAELNKLVTSTELAERCGPLI